jgi:hypothetical protein
MRTAALRTTKLLIAGMAAAAMTLMGCGPHAAAVPPGFPNLDSFAAAPVDNYISIGPKGPGRFVALSTPYTIECGFTATTDLVPAGSLQKGPLRRRNTQRGIRPHRHRVMRDRHHQLIWRIGGFAPNVSYPVARSDHSIPARCWALDKS